MRNSSWLMLVLGSTLLGQVKTATSTSLTSSLSPAQIGQTVTLMATVSPAAIGTVTFLDRFEILGTAVLNGSSVASLPIRFTAPRTYRLRAVYAGSATSAGSVSTVLPLPVKALPSGSFPVSLPIPTSGLFRDVNRDGKPDIVGSDTRVYLANGDGSYQNPIASISGVTGAIADFNNDGKPDLLTDQGMLALGNGNGTWAAPQATSLTYRVTDNSVDLNLDGRADAVVGVPPLGHGQESTSYSLGNGSGGFAQPVAISAPISFADFNGNTTADGLAFPTSNVPIPVGAFEFFDLESANNSIELAVLPTAGILVGDINGDGFDDVVTNQSSDFVVFQIVVQLSNGSGGLGGQTLASSSAPYSAIQLLDWDSDSKLDILVSQPVNATTSTVGYLPGQGNGTFGALVSIATIPKSPFLAVTEVNGDSYPDLLLFNSSNEPASVLLGAPAGGTATGVTNPVSVSPNNGSGTGGDFALTYTTAAAGGAPNPAVALEYVLFNNSIAGSGGCFVEINPSRNEFRLWSDSSQSWLGPVRAGMLQQLGNGLCALSAAGSQAGIVNLRGAAVDYQSTIRLSFASSFAGTKNIYLLSLGTDGSNSGWKQLGTWTIPTSGGTNPGGGVPRVVGLTPLSGSGTAGTFTGTYFHAGGAQGHYLGYMLFLPTPNVVNFLARGSCLVEYNRISNGMRLIDDAGTSWLGGVSGIAVGQAGNSLSNSACTVNVAGATATLAGNTMTVTVPVTFASNFGPVLATFLQELDVNNVWTGMTQFGDWIVPTASPSAAGPSIVSTTIQKAGTPTISITANGGVSLPTQVHLRIGASILAERVCHVVYAPLNGAVALINDEGTALVSGFVAIGTNQNLSNTSCSLNAASVVRMVSGSETTVAIPLTQTDFGANPNVYVNVFDNQGRLTHWRNFGPLF